jgi:hypothetical protein
VCIVDNSVWSREDRGSSQQIRACWVAALSGAHHQHDREYFKTMTHRVLPHLRSYQTAVVMVEAWPWRMRGYTKLSYAWPTTPSYRRTSGSHNVHARRAKRKVTSGLFSCANRLQITHTHSMPWSHTHTACSERHDTEWLATPTSQHATHSSLGMSLGESSTQPRLPFAHSVQGQTWWMRVRWLVVLEQSNVPWLR